MIRILLVDDQNLVQQGIKSLLDGEPELKVIGTVENGRSAIAEIAYLRPDIVLLDIEMPGMNGITTTKYISRLSPRTKVIILSSHEDKKYVTQALMAGAKGYILKNSLISDLKQAILAVNNGYSQIDSKLLAKVFDPSNLKAKKRQSKSDQVEDIPNQTKTDVQGQDFLDLESQEADSTFKLSEKYQLGASPVDSVESRGSSSKAKLNLESKSEIIPLEIFDVPVSEQDTFIQNNDHNLNLLELENLQKNQPKPTFLKEDSEAKVPDFQSWRQTVPDIESENLDDLPKQGYIESDRISHSNQIDDRTDSSILQPSSEKSRVAQTVTRVATKSTMPTPYPSNLARFTSTQKQNKSKFLRLLKKSLNYSWVWNVILMVLGAVIVIIIGIL